MRYAPKQHDTGLDDNDVLQLLQLFFIPGKFNTVRRGIESGVQNGAVVQWSRQVWKNHHYLNRATTLECQINCCNRNLQVTSSVLREISSITF